MYDFSSGICFDFSVCAAAYASSSSLCGIRMILVQTCVAGIRLILVQPCVHGIHMLLVQPCEAYV